MKISPQSIFAKVLIAGLLLSYSSAFAAENENETDVVRRETAAIQQVSSTARQAELNQPYEGRKVTFEDILKDPDNPELNFLYAQEQVRQNDLLGAVGTLERVLAVRPDLHEVRLFYAVVLYRLDNLAEAEREIQILEKAPLSGKMREEWKNYRREIKLRKKRTRFAVTQSIGYEFDTNRNASPSSKKVLFADALINNSVESRRRSDESFLSITNVDVVHDLGFQAGHTVFANFTHYLQNQNHVDTLDLGSLQYELGGTYRSRWFDFTPSFFASHVYLSDENYLRTQGGDFLISRNFDKTSIYGRYRLERQDYMPIKENQSAGQRDGYDNTVSTGASYVLLPSMRVSAELLYSYKNARANFEAYDRYGFKVGHNWLLGKGQFLINTIDTSFDRYEEQDAAIATRFRKDAIFRYRVTYGAPLTFFQIGKILPGPFKNIIASFSYEYFRSLSNITNYTYTNNKIQGILTKKWEF